MKSTVRDLLPANYVMVVEGNPETGQRLKYYGRAADADYWTEAWTKLANQPYDRELRGHLPLQLRGTFRRLIKRGARVLEAGCGLGHFTVATHSLGYRAEGLDWSEKTIQRLRELFPRIPWHVGDVRKLAFEDCAFDAVYSPGVCEHFEEGPTHVFAEMRRVLRPGGVAFIGTPCFNRWLQARSARFSFQGEPNGEFYQYAFAPDGIKLLLERLGFGVLQVRPFGSLTTMIEFAGWKIPQPVMKPLAVVMDYAPVVREWGYACLWIARRTT